MLDADGVTFGGTNDVVSTWDGTLNTAVTDTNFNMTMKSDSDFKFFGFVWTCTRYPDVWTGYVLV